MYKSSTLILLTVGLCQLFGAINCRPATEEQVDDIPPPPPPLISFDRGGNVGVNFNGYRASAGLGGLLTGDETLGRIHAEAGIPTGQEAAAGLGGSVGNPGRTGGGLYAGATAGNGIGAGAGLGGEIPIERNDNGIPPIENREDTVYVEKTKIRNGHHPHKYHYVNKNVIVQPEVAAPQEVTPILSAPFGGQPTTVVRKRVNPQLFNDIFNIPIATLEAVSKLISGIVGSGAGGTVQKTIHQHPQ